MVVRVLGSTVLESGTGEQVITSRAMRSLLASLALQADSPVRVDVLAGWVWGEDDLPEHPVPALQTVVSRLRRTLRGSGGSATVETVPGGYVLRVRQDQVDALRFESLVGRARELARRGHPEQALEMLDAALALWGGGQALIDVTHSRAALSEAVRLEELRLSALQDRIELLLGLRSPRDVLAELARLTSRYPLREAFAGQYMVALEACDQRAEALEVYRRLAHAMHDQLGVGPGAAIRAIHAGLLTERPADTAGDRPRSAGAPTRSAASDATSAAVSDSASPGVSWPVRVGTPPALAAAFQVRTQLRARIEAALAGDARSVVVTQVMAGDGGVGKTQLAAAMFYDTTDGGGGVGDGCGVDLGVWVTATSRDAVLAAYAAAYPIVHPPAAAVHQEVEERAAAFLGWLADTDRSWMIVLDDVADPADLNQLRPRGSTGRVLVTTRRRDAAMTAIGSIVDVGLFTPAESLAYLHERLQQPYLPNGVLDDAAALAADLGHLPLALAQAAAVIINDAITCTEYRALLADRTLRLAEVFPTDPKASGDDYTHALPAAWSLATERAATTDPHVRAMLTLVAVLDPNGIPENVLLTPPITDHLGLTIRSQGDVYRPGALYTPRSTDSPDSSAGRLARAAIRTAHQFSLLTHTPGDPTRSVRMHALAQRATLEYLSPDDLASTVTAAADALLHAWPDFVADPDLAQVMRTNTTTLTARHPDALWQPDAHGVHFKSGRNLGLSGQSAKAVAYHADLTNRAHAVLGPDHPTTLTARHQLAEWRGMTGDWAGALSAFEAILTDRLRLLGPDHRDTLFTRYDLADCLGMSGDPAGAAAELGRLAADVERALGRDDYDRLTVRHDWAYWRGEAGDVHGAVQAFENQLSDAVRMIGADHQATLGTRYYLARCRGRAGDFAGAVRDLRALLDDVVRVLGPDNPYTLMTRRSLADWRGHAGEPDEAADELRALLSDTTRILGPHHPDAVTTRELLQEWQAKASAAGAGS